MFSLLKKDIPEHLLKYFKPKRVYKQKDDAMIPHRVFDALMADGWYGRQDVCWFKGNPMPESVTDRCTKAHEFLFLLTKSKKYYFDNEAIKEPCSEANVKDFKNRKTLDNKGTHGGTRADLGRSRDSYMPSNFMRNKRSVWHVNTKPYNGAHFAVMPTALVEPCILAGTSEKGVCSVCGSPYKRVIEKTGEFQRRWSTNNAEDSPYNKQDSFQNLYSTVDWQPSCSCNAHPIPATVLDPFGGSGTVGEVCKSLGRNSILIELNPDYKPLIEKRIGE